MKAPPGSREELHPVLVRLDLARESAGPNIYCILVLE